MLNYLIIGTLLGLSAGVSPGPLMALLVSETVRHGSGAGYRVALAPLVTDLPIVAVAVLAVGSLSSFDLVLAAISLAGGVVVMAMGFANLLSKGTMPDLVEADSRPLLKGIAVNALSPHPYLFWASVGAPLTLKAAESGISPSAGFIAMFYLMLVGSKLVLAGLVGRSRHLLSGRGYLFTVRAMGLALVLLSFFLFHESWLLYDAWRQ